MKVVINGTTYTELLNLDFAPEADLMGNALPANTFSVDILTDDEIELNRIARLLDDNDRIWARYTIVDVYEVERGRKKIIAQSAVAILSKRNKKAVMYTAEPAEDILATFMNGINYTIDSRISGRNITGYFPEQTARERLLQLCFVIGAYVRSFFSETIDILPISESDELIALDRVYWKPKIILGDYVTKITVVSYTYAQGTPQSTDTWVKANGVYYIESSQEVSIINPDVPNYVQENEIVIKDVKVINQSNVSTILSRLTDYYFNRREIDCSIVDNGELYPGKRIAIYTDPDTIKRGYITSAEYKLGKVVKARLNLGLVDDVDTGILIINYVWTDTGGDQKTVKSSRFVLPIGYSFSIENTFVYTYQSKVEYASETTVVIKPHTMIFRPLQARTTGTMTASGITANVPVALAIDHYLESNITHVISVDDVSSSSGVVTIA